MSRSNSRHGLAALMAVCVCACAALAATYFDLATPFYQGVYEMHHLPIPQNLQANIEYRFYSSGHMVYAKDASLRQLHDNVADFIRRTGRSAQ